MAAPPKIPWNFPALCWLLALAIPGSLELQCGEHQYLFHEKCCSDCAPGERMRSRCTPTSDTVCSPCQDGYFSSKHHHGFCYSCTVCNSRKGSMEVKPCEKSSDRVCKCRPGFQPVRMGIPLGKECSRCPRGTFSRGGNEKCQPWTNCSFSGKSTLRLGTATEDSQCGGADPTEFPGKKGPNPTEFLGKKDPDPVEFPGKIGPIPVEFPGKKDLDPTEFPGRKDPDPTEFPGNSSREIPSVCEDPGNPMEPAWGAPSLLLLLLLPPVGIFLVLLLIRAARREPGPGSGRSPRRGGRSCRIPIQEQQMDSGCSLSKN